MVRPYGRIPTVQWSHKQRTTRDPAFLLVFLFSLGFSLDFRVCVSLTGGYQDKKSGKKIKGLTFLRGFSRKTWGKMRKHQEKWGEMRKNKGLTFLVLNFLIYLFCSNPTLGPATQGVIDGEGQADRLWTDSREIPVRFPWDFREKSPSKKGK